MASKPVHLSVIWLCYACACACVASLPVLPQPVALQMLIPSTLSSSRAEIFFLPDHATFPVVRGDIHIEYDFSAAHASSLANAEFTFDVALSFNISIPSFRTTYQTFPLQTPLQMARCSWNAATNTFSETMSSPLFVSASTLLAAVAAIYHTAASLLGPVYVHSCIVSAILTGPNTDFTLLKYTLDFHAGVVELGNLWSSDPYTSVGQLNAMFAYQRPLVVRSPASMARDSPLCIYAQWQLETSKTSSSSRMLASPYFAGDLFMDDENILDTYHSTVSNNVSVAELWIRIPYGSPEQYFLLRMLPSESTHELTLDLNHEPIQYDNGDDGVLVQFTSGACRLIPGGTGPDPTPTPKPPDPTQSDDRYMTAWQLSLCIVGGFICSMFLVLVAVVWQRQRRQQWGHEEGNEEPLVGLSSATQPLLYMSCEQVNEDDGDECR